MISFPDTLMHISLFLLMFYCNILWSDIDDLYLVTCFCHMYPYDVFPNKAFQRPTLDFDTQNEELLGRVMADML